MELNAAITERLEAISRSIIERVDVASAAIFVPAPNSTDLTLAAASGIDGDARDRLVTAVQDLAHPIALTLADGVGTFDVTPMAPGGPALLGHLPLRSPQK